MILRSRLMESKITNVALSRRGHAFKPKMMGTAERQLTGTQRDKSRKSRHGTVTKENIGWLKSILRDPILALNLLQYTAFKNKNLFSSNRSLQELVSEFVIIVKLYS